MSALCKVTKLGWENCLDLLPDSLYSADVDPIDFFLSSDLNKILGGKKFSDNEDVTAKTEAYDIISRRLSLPVTITSAFRIITRKFFHSSFTRPRPRPGVQI